MIAWVSIAAIVACGGADPATTSPAGNGGATGSGEHAKPVATAKLSAQECGAMIDHIVDIGHAEQKRTLAPDDVPTDEQIAKIKTNQRATNTAPCLELPRPAYDCAMRARTPGELRACDQAGP